MQSEPRSACTTVWALPISLAATFGITVVFSSSPYLDVSVRVVPSVHLWIQCTVHRVCLCGFPHSEIHGSQDMCSSPWLFAACHVLRRLPVPGHPPCALIRLVVCIALHTNSLIRSLPSGLFRVLPSARFSCLNYFGSRYLS